ncbi:hypothetical protein PSOL_00360 [Candidatus Phytoplasma solani]|uniref:hypothetical protein n=1 Tax=Candidatus Phytoplasma solani TaxID=69896 RepID=UPI0032DA9665
MSKLTKTLFEIIKLKNPKTSINFEILEKLNSQAISENQFNTAFQNTLLTKMKLNFLTSFKNNVNKIDIFNSNEFDFQKLNSQLFDFQNQLITSEISFGNKFKKYFEQNNTIEKERAPKDD